MKLRPVPKVNVVETIVDQFSSMIIQKEMKAGDQLPSEYELMEIFEVGRSSVREALKMLEASGIIERSSGRNTIVKPSNTLLSKPLSFLVALNDISMKELFETRSILEVANARYAAKRASKEHLDEMLYWLSQREKQKTDTQAEREMKLIANYSFHHTIAKAARNNATLAVFESLKSVLVASQDATLDRGNDEEYDNHIEIYKNIVKRDSQAASESMMRHLSKVYEAYLSDDE